MKRKGLVFSLLTALIVHQFAQGQERFSSELSPRFHQERREALRQKMPTNSVAVVFNAPIRNRANDVDYMYHPDPNFYYLTGWKEPHAVLVIFKDAQKDSLGTYREILFVRERNAREELWNGKREGLKGAESRMFDRIESRNGFSRTAIAYENFDQVLVFELGEDVRNFKGDPYDLYDLQEQFKQKINYPSNFNSTCYRLTQKIRTTPIADAERLKQQIAYSVKYDSTLLQVPVIKAYLNAQDPDRFTELRQNSAFELRTTNFDIDLLEQFLADLRQQKTVEELALLKKAVSISAQGQREVMKAIHPNMSEREIQGIHQYVYKRYGAAHEGYPSIVGAGENGCVLHYQSNDLKQVDNQLVLMDLGAEYQGYTADVTRTIPATGTFTPEQRQLYEVVYNAQNAGIAAAQQGSTFAAVSEATFAVVAQGLLDLGIIKNTSEMHRYLPHGIAHHIGLDVHDLGNYDTLEENMVITVEPGIYIPENSPCDPKWWNIAIRIEDDIQITPTGPVNLSAAAPREWEAIEALMREPSPLDDFTLPSLWD